MFGKAGASKALATPEDDDDTEAGGEVEEALDDEDEGAFMHAEAEFENEGENRFAEEFQTILDLLQLDVEAANIEIRNRIDNLYLS